MRIWIILLSLSLLKRFSQTKNWARQYARETMTYGGFDKVRYSANDLHNMLAVVDGDPAITLKLANKNAAQALRQRQSVPTLVVKRYLRLMNDDYAFLGAWNFEKEIKQKEKSYLRRGGKFIVHVPKVRII